MKQQLELYVHIPFCVRKCGYCDFFSGPFGVDAEVKYFRDVTEEIRSAGKKVPQMISGITGEVDGSFLPEMYEVVSVFFGGGTPSCVSGEDVAEVMRAIRDVFTIAEGAEITLEANPGTLTREKLKIYRALGVNRLSIGLQSTQDRLLRALGRIHTYDDFLESYRLSREEGFANINIDLMSGLPGETVQDHREILKRAVSLRAEHLSCYSLILEEGTPFFEKYGKDLSLLPSEEEDREMYHDTKSMLAEAGYLRYEISNYALEGFRCRHNIGYWTGIPYLGFGAAAASFVPLPGGRAVRFKNAETLSYRRQPLWETELLSPADRMAEFMILGLRMTEGVCEEEFRRRFGVSMQETYGKIFEKYAALGALSRSEEKGSVCLTDYGMDVSNRILEEFL